MLRVQDTSRFMKGKGEIRDQDLIMRQGSRPRQASWCAARVRHALVVYVVE